MITRAGGAARALLPFVVVLAAWQAIAMVATGLKVIPTPLAVVEAFAGDLGIYGENVWATVSVAAKGFVIGNLAAVTLAVAFVHIAWAERLLLKIAVASFCVPLVAVAPILTVTLPGDGPQVALAVLSVFFTTLISVVLGLRSADPAALTVIRSMGGSSWHALLKVRFFAVLPGLFSALKIAAPAALLGAIIGEYLGASKGLGVMLVLSQSSFQVSRTWAVALVMSAIAGLAYAIWGAVSRWVTPWASQEVSLSSGMPGAAATSSAKALVASIAGALGSIAIVVAAWYGLIAGFNLNSYFAKNPADVVAYLFTEPEAAAQRQRVWDGLLITLGDAAMGYVAGTIVAVAIAVLVVTFKQVESTLMPLAIVLRSVPLVAMTPLLALIFGRGMIGVTVIVSIVVFFPTLVNVVMGLRSAPNLAIDVVRSLGGSNALATWKVRALYALPAFFAAARIAVPGALAGATLVEWLATGKGIGAMLVQDYAASRSSALWAESVVIVAASVVIYGFIGLIEKQVLRRYAP